MSKEESFFWINKIEKFNKIDNHTKVIENEIKKANWYTNGIVSKISWIKNMIFTPKFTAIDPQQQREQDYQSNSINSAGKPKNPQDLITGNKYDNDEDEVLDSILDQLDNLNHKKELINSTLQDQTSQLERTIKNSDSINKQLDSISNKHDKFL